MRLFKILVLEYDHSHLMIYSIPLAADSTSFSDSAMLPIVSLTTLGEKYVIYVTLLTFNSYFETDSTRIGHDLE